MKDIYDEWIDPKKDFRSSEFTIDLRSFRPSSRSPSKLKSKAKGVFAYHMIGNVKLTILTAYMVLSYRPHIDHAI
jgi:hypothetical protein